MKSNIAVVCLDYKIALEVAKILADELDMYFLDIQGLYDFDIKPRTIAETMAIAIAKYTKIPYEKKTFPNQPKLSAKGKGVLIILLAFENLMVSTNSSIKNWAKPAPNVVSANPTTFWFTLNVTVKKAYIRPPTAAKSIANTIGIIIKNIHCALFALFKAFI